MFKHGTGFAKRVAKLATASLQRDVSYLMAVRHFGQNQMVGGGGIDVIRQGQANLESKIKQMNLDSQQLLCLKVALDDSFQDILLQLSKDEKNDELKNVIEKLQEEVKELKEKAKESVFLQQEVKELKEKSKESEEKQKEMAKENNEIKEQIRYLLKKSEIQSSLISTIFTVYNNVHLKILARQLIVIIDHLSATYFSLLTGKLLWTKDPPKFVNVFQESIVELKKDASDEEINKFKEFYDIYKEKWQNMVEDGHLAAHPKLEFSTERQLVLEDLQKIEKAFDEELKSDKSDSLGRLVIQFKESKLEIEALFETVMKLNESIKLSDPQLSGLTQKSVANKDFKYLKQLHSSGGLIMANAGMVRSNFGDNSLHDESADK